LDQPTTCNTISQVSIGSYHAFHHHDVSDGFLKALMPSFATNAKIKEFRQENLIALKTSFPF